METQHATVGTPLGYMSQHVFQMRNNAGAYTDRERGMFSIHWVNSTGGNLDTTWIAADYLAVEAAAEAFWAANGSKISSDFRLVEHRWYAYGAGILPPNPPSRVTTIGTPVVGSATTGYVHQLATTITIRTALRRHWGRFYMPVDGGQPSGGGQFSAAWCDAVAAAARTFLAVTPAVQGIYPVVWDKNRKLAFTMTQLEVDSVPDIIRRRRPRTTNYKKLISA